MSERMVENQHALSSELGRIAATLEAHAGGQAPESAGGRQRPLVLDSLAGAFGLSPFERDILLLCAGMELDARFPSLCAAAAGDERASRPTFGLALSCLPDPHWSAVAPAAPLRHYRLIELDGGGNVAMSPIWIDERVLHHLVGLEYLDVRLQGVVSPLDAPDGLPPSHEPVVAALARAVARGAPRTHLVVALGGSTSECRRAAAVHAFVRLGLAPHVMRATDVPAHAAERDSFVRLWRREVVLGGSALLVELDDDADVELRGRVAALADELDAPVVLSSREPVAGIHSTVVRLEVGNLPPTEQRAIWVRELGGRAAHLNGAVDAIVSHFDLGPQAISEACAEVAGIDDDDLAGALWGTCRQQARLSLDDLAQRIEAVAGWDDLVLPAAEADVLREIAMHVRGRALVYEEWGFARKSTRGLGISALFEGASGTGKTMAAEVLGRELELDLYRIDLSQVVSKYIGETEKNLRRVFDAAEAGGAILLFDEADALFGKRSEVKDSHDRYANIEVSYLLQRMEEYRGLAILTTNLPDALDDAFLRRIRFVVRFPFPDHAERLQIWRRIFPAEAPVSALEEDALAGLSLAGGNIRNVALAAAFLAADEREPIGMRHLARAAARECAKLERPLTETAVRGWL